MLWDEEVAAPYRCHPLNTAMLQPCLPAPRGRGRGRGGRHPLFDPGLSRKLCGERGRRAVVGVPPVSTGVRMERAQRIIDPSGARAPPPSMHGTMGAAVKTSKTRALLVIKEYKLGNIKETAGSNPEGFVCLACEVNRGERWD